MEPIHGGLDKYFNPEAFEKNWRLAKDNFYAPNQSFHLPLGYDPNWDKGYNVQGESQEQNRWNNQSGFGVAAKAAGRLIGTFGTKTLTGISDIVGLATLTDAAHNPISQIFRNVEEQIKEELPIYAQDKYYTGDVLDKIATSKWWSESFIDGLAFLGSAWATGGGTAKAIGALSNIGKVKSITESIGLAESSLAQGIELTQASKSQKIINEMVKLGLTNNSAQRVAVTAVNTLSESMAEGYESYNTLKEDLTRKKSLGASGNSEYAKYKDLTADQIENASMEAYRGTFYKNLLLLPFSNSLEAKWIVGKGSSMEQLGKEALAKNGLKGLDEVIPDNIPKTKFLTEFIKGVATEGFLEENFQTAFSKYEQAISDPTLTEKEREFLPTWIDHINTNLRGTKNAIKGILGGQAPRAGSEEAEGFESIFLGSLLGGFGGPVGALRGHYDDLKTKSNLKNFWEGFEKNENLLKQGFKSDLSYTAKNVNTDSDTIEFDKEKLIYDLQRNFFKERISNHAIIAESLNNDLYKNLNAHYALFNLALEIETKGYDEETKNLLSQRLVNEFNELKTDKKDETKILANDVVTLDNLNNYRNIFKDSVINNFNKNINLVDNDLEFKDFVSRVTHNHAIESFRINMLNDMKGRVKSEKAKASINDLIEYHTDQKNLYDLNLNALSIKDRFNEFKESFKINNSSKEYKKIKEDISKVENEIKELKNKNESTESKKEELLNLKASLLKTESEFIDQVNNFNIHQVHDFYSKDKNKTKMSSNTQIVGRHAVSLDGINNILNKTSRGTLALEQLREAIEDKDYNKLANLLNTVEDKEFIPIANYYSKNTLKQLESWLNDDSQSVEDTLNNFNVSKDTLDKNNEKGKELLEQLNRDYEMLKIGFSLSNNETIQSIYENLFIKDPRSKEEIEELVDFLSLLLKDNNFNNLTDIDEDGYDQMSDIKRSINTFLSTYDELNKLIEYKDILEKDIEDLNLKLTSPEFQNKINNYNLSKQYSSLIKDAQKKYNKYFSFRENETVAFFYNQFNFKSKFNEAFSMIEEVFNLYDQVYSDPNKYFNVDGSIKEDVIFPSANWKKLYENLDDFYQILFKSNISQSNKDALFNLLYQDFYTKYNINLGDLLSFLKNIYKHESNRAEDFIKRLQDYENQNKESSENIIDILGSLEKIQFSYELYPFLETFKKQNNKDSIQQSIGKLENVYKEKVSNIINIVRSIGVSENLISSFLRNLNVSNTETLANPLVFINSFFTSPSGVISKMIPKVNDNSLNELLEEPSFLKTYLTTYDINQTIKDLMVYDFEYLDKSQSDKIKNEIISFLESVNNLKYVYIAHSYLNNKINYDKILDILYNFENKNGFSPNYQQINAILETIVFLEKQLSQSKKFETTKEDEFISLLNPFMIGLMGVSGSGKSSISKSIIDYYISIYGADNILLIGHTDVSASNIYNIVNDKSNSVLMKNINYITNNEYYQWMRSEEGLKNINKYKFIVADEQLALTNNEIIETNYNLSAELSLENILTKGSKSNKPVYLFLGDPSQPKGDVNSYLSIFDFPDTLSRSIDMVQPLFVGYRTFVPAIGQLAFNYKDSSNFINNITTNATISEESFLNTKMPPEINIFGVIANNKTNSKENIIDNIINRITNETGKNKRKRVIIVNNNDEVNSYINEFAKKGVMIDNSKDSNLNILSFIDVQGQTFDEAYLDIDPKKPFSRRIRNEKGEIEYKLHLFENTRKDYFNSVMYMSITRAKYFVFLNTMPNVQVENKFIDSKDNKKLFNSQLELDFNKNSYQEVLSNIQNKSNGISSIKPEIKANTKTEEIKVEEVKTEESEIEEIEKKEDITEDITENITEEAIKEPEYKKNNEEQIEKQEEEDEEDRVDNFKLNELSIIDDKDDINELVAPIEKKIINSTIETNEFYSLSHPSSTHQQNVFININNERVEIEVLDKDYALDKAKMDLSINPFTEYYYLNKSNSITSILPILDENNKIQTRVIVLSEILNKYGETTGHYMPMAYLRTDATKEFESELDLPLFNDLSKPFKAIRGIHTGATYNMLLEHAKKLNENKTISLSDLNSLQLDLNKYGSISKQINIISNSDMSFSYEWGTEKDYKSMYNTSTNIEGYILNFLKSLAQGNNVNAKYISKTIESIFDKIEDTKGNNYWTFKKDILDSIVQASVSKDTKIVFTIATPQLLEHKGDNIGILNDSPNKRELSNIVNKLSGHPILIIKNLKISDKNKTDFILALDRGFLTESSKTYTTISSYRDIVNKLEYSLRIDDLFASTEMQLLAYAGKSLFNINNLESKISPIKINDSVINNFNNELQLSMQKNLEKELERLLIQEEYKALSEIKTMQIGEKEKNVLLNKLKDKIKSGTSTTKAARAYKEYKQNQEDFFNYLNKNNLITKELLQDLQKLVYGEEGSVFGITESKGSFKADEVILDYSKDEIFKLNLEAIKEGLENDNEFSFYNLDESLKFELTNIKSKSKELIKLLNFNKLKQLDNSDNQLIDYVKEVISENKSKLNINSEEDELNYFTSFVIDINNIKYHVYKSDGNNPIAINRISFNLSASNLYKELNNFAKGNSVIETVNGSKRIISRKKTIKQGKGKNKKEISKYFIAQPIDTKSETNFMDFHKIIMEGIFESAKRQDFDKVAKFQRKENGKLYVVNNSFDPSAWDYQKEATDIELDENKMKMAQALKSEINSYFNENEFGFQLLQDVFIKDYYVQKSIEDFNNKFNSPFSKDVINGILNKIENKTAKNNIKLIDNNDEFSVDLFNNSISNKNSFTQKVKNEVIKALDENVSTPNMSVNPSYTIVGPKNINNNSLIKEESLEKETEKENDQNIKKEDESILSIKDSKYKNSQAINYFYNLLDTIDESNNLAKLAEFIEKSINLKDEVDGYVDGLEELYISVSNFNYQTEQILNIYKKEYKDKNKNLTIEDINIKNKYENYLKELSSISDIQFEYYDKLDEYRLTLNIGNEKVAFATQPNTNKNLVSHNKIKEYLSEVLPNEILDHSIYIIESLGRSHNLSNVHNKAITYELDENKMISKSILDHEYFHFVFRYGLNKKQQDQLIKAYDILSKNKNRFSFYEKEHNLALLFQEYMTNENLGKKLEENSSKSKKTLLEKAIDYIYNLFKSIKDVLFLSKDKRIINDYFLKIKEGYFSQFINLMEAQDRPAYSIGDLFNKLEKYFTSESEAVEYIEDVQNRILHLLNNNIYVDESKTDSIKLTIHQIIRQVFFDIKEENNITKKYNLSLIKDAQFLELLMDLMLSNIGSIASFSKKEEDTNINLENEILTNENNDFLNTAAHDLNHLLFSFTMPYKNGYKFISQNYIKYLLLSAPLRDEVELVSFLNEKNNEKNIVNKIIYNKLKEIVNYVNYEVPQYYGSLHYAYYDNQFKIIYSPVDNLSLEEIIEQIKSNKTNNSSTPKVFNIKNLKAITIFNEIKKLNEDYIKSLNLNIENHNFNSEIYNNMLYKSIAIKNMATLSNTIGSSKFVDYTNTVYDYNFGDVKMYNQSLSLKNNEFKDPVKMISTVLPFHLTEALQDMQDLNPTIDLTNLMKNQSIKNSITNTIFNKIFSKLDLSNKNIADIKKQIYDIVNKLDELEGVNLVEKMLKDNRLNLNEIEDSGEDFDLDVDIDIDYIDNFLKKEEIAESISIIAEIINSINIDTDAINYSIKDSDGSNIYTIIMSTFMDDIYRKLYKKYNKNNVHKYLEHPFYRFNAFAQKKQIIHKIKTHNVHFETRRESSKDYMAENKSEVYRRIISYYFFKSLVDSKKTNITYLQETYPLEDRGRVQVAEINFLSEKELINHLGSILNFIKYRKSIDNDVRAFVKTKNKAKEDYNHLLTNLSFPNDPNGIFKPLTFDLIEKNQNEAINNILYNLKQEATRIVDEMLQFDKNFHPELMEAFDILKRKGFMDFSKNPISKLESIFPKGKFEQYTEAEINSEEGVVKKSFYFYKNPNAKISEKEEIRKHLIDALYGYTLNRYVNSYDLNQMIIGDHTLYENIQDIVKRLLGPSAPGMSVYIGNYGMTETTKALVVEDNYFTTKESPEFKLIRDNKIKNIKNFIEDFLSKEEYNNEAIRNFYEETISKLDSSNFLEFRNKLNGFIDFFIEKTKDDFSENHDTIIKELLDFKKDINNYKYNSIEEFLNRMFNGDQNIINKLLPLYESNYEITDGFSIMSEEGYNNLKAGMNPYFNLASTIKAVYFGISESHIKNSPIPTPLYVKNSYLVLTKELIEQFPNLKKINDFMKSANVHEVVFNSALKIGKPKSSIKMEEIEQYDTYNNRSLPANIDDAILTLDNKYRRIQYNPKAEIESDVANPSQTLYMQNILTEKSSKAKNIYQALSYMYEKSIFNYTKKVNNNLSKVIKKTISSSPEALFYFDVLNSNQDLSILLNDPFIKNKFITHVISNLTKETIGKRYRGTKMVIAPAEILDRKLTYVKENINGKEIIKAEVIMPLDFFKNEQFIKDLGGINEAKEYLKNGGSIFMSGEAFGVRLPTTGKGSSFVLKVVDVHENKDNIMFIPTEIAKIMGADFDIDTKFIFRRQALKKDINFTKFNLSFKQGSYPGYSKDNNSLSLNFNILDFNNILAYIKEEQDVLKSNLYKTFDSNEIDIILNQISNLDELEENLLQNFIVENIIDNIGNPHHSLELFTPISSSFETDIIDHYKNNKGYKEELSNNYNLSLLYDYALMKKNITEGARLIGSTASAYKDFAYLIRSGLSESILNEINLILDKEENKNKNSINDLSEADKLQIISLYKKAANDIIKNESSKETIFSYKDSSISKLNIKPFVFKNKDYGVSYDTLSEFSYWKNDSGEMEVGMASWSVLNAIMNDALDNLKTGKLAELKLTLDNQAAIIAMIMLGMPFNIKGNLASAMTYQPVLQVLNQGFFEGEANMENKIGINDNYINITNLKIKTKNKEKMGIAEIITRMLFILNPNNINNHIEKNEESEIEKLSLETLLENVDLNKEIFDKNLSKQSKEEGGINFVDPFIKASNLLFRNKNVSKEELLEILNLNENEARQFLLEQLKTIYYFNRLNSIGSDILKINRLLSVLRKNPKKISEINKLFDDIKIVLNKNNKKIENSENVESSENSFFKLRYEEDMGYHNYVDAINNGSFFVETPNFSLNITNFLNVNPHIFSSIAVLNSAKNIYNSNITIYNSMIQDVLNFNFNSQLMKNSFMLNSNFNEYDLEELRNEEFIKFSFFKNFEELNLFDLKDKSLNQVFDTFAIAIKKHNILSQNKIIANFNYKKQTVFFSKEKLPQIEEFNRYVPLRNQLKSYYYNINENKFIHKDNLSESEIKENLINVSFMIGLMSKLSKSNKLKINQENALYTILDAETKLNISKVFDLALKISINKYIKPFNVIIKTKGYKNKSLDYFRNFENYNVKDIKKLVDYLDAYSLFFLNRNKKIIKKPRISDINFDKINGKDRMFKFSNSKIKVYDPLTYKNNMYHDLLIKKTSENMPGTLNYKGMLYRLTGITQEEMASYEKIPNYKNLINLTQSPLISFLNQNYLKITGEIKYNKKEDKYYFLTNQNISDFLNEKKNILIIDEKNETNNEIVFSEIVSEPVIVLGEEKSKFAPAYYKYEINKIKSITKIDFNIKPNDHLVQLMKEIDQKIEELESSCQI